MQNTLSASAEDQALFRTPGVQSLFEQVRESAQLTGDGAVELLDAARLRAEGIDRLVHAAVFGEDADVRDTARWIIGELAQQIGIRPASIHDLYLARGRGEVGGFT
ncbi:MAG: hypothetical protein H0V06_01860, partial [Gemmatimonadetes bacterium]|nr:hypothetical protein [Gemmatimonadota bacterium]